MLLRRLKSNRARNLFIIPLAAVVFWIKSLLQPFTYGYFDGESNNILFAPVFRLTAPWPLLQVLLSLILVIGLAFLMQLINDNFSFIRIKSKLPSILFVIILGGFTEMHTLHPVFFGTIFILLAILQLFQTFEKAKPYSALFNVGFLLGIGALFYFSLIVLFPAFLIGAIILSKERSWRNYTILTLGFLLPFVFASSYAFLTDTFQQTSDIFIKSILTPVNHFKGNIILQVYMVVLVLYTLIGTIDILMQYDNKKISSRKYFKAFFWIFNFSMAGFILIPATSQEMLIIAAIPFTFLIGNLFVFMKSKFWSELLFSMLLIIVILIQFA